MIGFWIFMLIMDLLIPVTMIIFGKMFLSKAPEEINFVFGYRTTRSMQNRDTWAFAHNYFGKIWFRLGMIMLPLSIIPLLAVFGRDIETIGVVGGIVCFVQLVPMAGSIIPTEIALKKTFEG